MITKQQTIKYPVSITGYGLQTGYPTTCKISPATENTGIVFFPAHGGVYKTVYSKCNNVTECILSTDIRYEENTVSTIEHLMSALHALGIDNAKITLSGSNEVPILDGSSNMWYTLIKSAGIIKLNAERKYITVNDDIIVSDDNKWIRISPFDGLIIDCTIKFDHPWIGEEKIVWNMDKGSYYHDISFAKTFGFESHIRQMRDMGYLKGGDKDTAIILTEDGISKEGASLRYADEFVRHKLIDLIGDIYINGPIKGYITSYCSGHDLNSKLMRAIYEQEKQVFVRERDAQRMGQIHY